MMNNWAYWILYLLVPILFLGAIVLAYFYKEKASNHDKKYQVHFKLKKGKFKIENIRRGVSVIGSAGSGKTESVIYNFLQHFSTHGFCGIIHDYKHFELTEMALPLFREQDIPFFTIAFDEIHFRVNPIAPRYLPNEESVNEISKVLLENLLEQNLSENTGTNKFFTDAVEGLLSGLIWKMKTSYPEICTLPHIIMLFQAMSTKKLEKFLKSDLIARNLAGAFLNGLDSEKQTAGVKSSLANAFKKISSQKIFYVLSADDVPLDVNRKENKAVISIVNNPQYESAYSPLVAAIIHTVIKQMSVRNRESSFILMEEAPTIKLPNMHRIPATMRSFDIATIYVMQDKVQNDLLYGEKAGKAILSNLSYQFFGKVNDPDTAKYYERFFELVKQPTFSVNRGHNLNFDTRITKGEKEVSKRKAEVFFKLKEGEFIVFADGEDKKILFEWQIKKKEKPVEIETGYSEEVKNHMLNIQKDLHQYIKLEVEPSQSD